MPHASVAGLTARKFRRTVAASLPVTLVAVLAGCGQKGALMLPAAPSSTPMSMSVPEAMRSVEQPEPPSAEPAGSAPVR